MKLVLASCLLLSLVGVSQQFLGLGHLKLGFLGGAKLGLLKSQLKSGSSSSSKKESCRSVPQQQCKNVEETVEQSSGVVPS